MSKEREQLFKILMEKQGESIETLAKDLQVSADFVRGIAAGDGTFGVTNGFVLLRGLGQSRCIVCSKTDYMDRERYSSLSTVEIEIPQELLTDYERDSALPRKIRGHRKCMPSLDVYFRYKEEDSLICWACSSWSGGWATENEVVEKCDRHGWSELGHRGVIGAKDMCNFFHPNYEIRNDPEHKDKLDKWERIRPEIEARTQQGYQNLISHLEKLRLLRKKEQPAKTG